jgi:hypothetical protein
VHNSADPGAGPQVAGLANVSDTGSLARRQEFPWRQLALVIGSSSLSAAIIKQFAPSDSAQWLFGAVLAIAAVTTAYILRAWLTAPYLRLHGIATHLTPWMGVVGLVAIVLIYRAVRPPLPPTTIPIVIDTITGGIFNSWESLADAKGHIRAWGAKDRLQWALDDNGTGYFSYETDLASPATRQDESSGGYVTFYETPCDIRVYRHVKFALRATDYTGVPDIGVRLVVDDLSSSARNRERVIYELPSLNRYRRAAPKVSRDWQIFVVDARDFTQTRLLPSAPSEDRRTHINKLVFFVDQTIAAASPRATLWVRDVACQMLNP